MEPSNDISHSVRDAFQEWGRKAKVAATSAYVALPTLMALTPAYAHETSSPHTHGSSNTFVDASVGATLVTGCLLLLGAAHSWLKETSGYQPQQPSRGTYTQAGAGVALFAGAMAYTFMH